jgi:hypothetical protein
VYNEVPENGVPGNFRLGKQVASHRRSIIMGRFRRSRPSQRNVKRSAVHLRMFCVCPILITPRLQFCKALVRSPRKLAHLGGGIIPRSPFYLARVVSGSRKIISGLPRYMVIAPYTQTWRPAYFSRFPKAARSSSQIITVKSWLG